jgi:hypothetical protein
MAMSHNGAYSGYQDDLGWHPATARGHPPHPRPVVSSLPQPLPLALAG